MKKIILLRLTFLLAFSLICNLLTAQIPSEKIKNEITEALKLWNTAAKNANTDQMMTLFDNSENIMLVGSDSGEIFKGNDHIKLWLSQIFKHNSFSWEMNIIDIDYYRKTAWVFVDGTMIITNDKGKIRRTPYRFTGILVKKKGVWKWRLFDGSIPKSERN